MEIEFIVKHTSEIGSFLKTERIAMKATQDDLANYAGLSRGGVIKLEKGNGDIKLSTLIRVTGLLGIEMVLRKRTNK